MQALVPDCHHQLRFPVRGEAQSLMAFCCMSGSSTLASLALAIASAIVNLKVQLEADNHLASDLEVQLKLHLCKAMHDVCIRVKG